MVAWLRGCVVRCGNQERKEASIMNKALQTRAGDTLGQKILSIVTHSNYTRHLKLTYIDINSMTYILTLLHVSCA